MDAIPPPAHTVRLEYFGPHTSIPFAARTGVWREGRLLSLFDGSPLPDGCVHCGGGPADTVRLRLPHLPQHMRRFASFAFVLLGFARRADVDVGLCAGCRARVGELFRIGVYLLIAGLALTVHAIWQTSEDAVAGACAAFIAAGCLWRRAQPLAVASMDRGVLRLTGAGAGYLSPLPIGGPPGIGVTPAELADRLAHVAEPVPRSRRTRRRRHRGRGRRGRGGRMSRAA